MFHHNAVWRARKHFSKGLTHEHGVIHTEQAAMMGMANEYFQHIFSTSHLLDPGDVVQLSQPKVTIDMNDKLCAEFSEKEILDAMFQIETLKSPGPDGFLPRFFQRHWSVLKEDIINSVKLFFATRVMSNGLKSTTSVLTP